MSSTLPRVDIRARIRTELTRVIPELESEHFRADRSIRDQLDIDSMDLLNFVIGLSKSFGLPIPEVDYKRIATVDALVDYVEVGLQASAAQSQSS